MLRHAPRDTIPQRWRARCRARAHRRPRRRPARHSGSSRHRGPASAGGRGAVRAVSRRARSAADGALASRGVDQLYTHQAEAIEHALAGRHTVVITPTASGKTLCYNAPVLDAILQDPSSRALYLFPTKALAQDQLAELQAMCETIDARDRRADRRLHLRRRHAAGRAAHDPLARAPRAQQSRHGALGDPAAPSALGEAVREPALRRSSTSCTPIAASSAAISATCCGGCAASAAHYGSNPVFLCSSATIANPRELAERLTEQPFELVDRSGAPRGEKFFVFVNPPVVNHQLGIRRSYLAETRRIASEFLKRNLQLIVFAQSRLSTEILTTYLKDDFEGIPGAPEQIRGYRGGYLPHAAARDRERAARRRGARGGVDQRARARHRHRRARRVGDGRLSGHDRLDLAARRARGPAQRPVGGGDGGEQRAARSVRRAQPVVLLRRVARARADRSRQPAHPGRPHQVRGVRAAVQRDRRVRPSRPAGDSRASWPSRASCIAPTRIRAVDLDQRVVSGRRGQPAVGVVGQLRRSSTSRSETRVIGETDFTSGPSTLHPKAIYIVEGQLYPGGAARLRGAQGVRPADRLRLLHDRDHLHAG